MSFQDVRANNHNHNNNRNNNGNGALTSNRVSLASSTPVIASSSSSSPSSSSPLNTNTAPPLRDALLQYQQQVNLYEKLARTLGGPRDDQELRHQLHAQESVVKEMSTRLDTQINTHLRNTDSLPTKVEKDRVRAEINKMSKDAQRLRLRFENLVRGSGVRIRELDLVGRRVEESLAGQGRQGMGGGGGGGVGGGGGRLQQLMQQQVQQQAEDVDEQLLQEREQEIMAINQSVVKVNEIFRDLGELVQRQQEDIDTIEQNVQTSHAAAKQGLEQVEKAAKYQQSCSIS